MKTFVLLDANAVLQSPRIDGVKVYDNKAAKNEIIIDFDVLLVYANIFILLPKYLPPQFQL